MFGFITYDWEIDNMQCFLSRLQDKVVVERGEDKMHKLTTKSGSFSVKSLTLHLREEV